MSTVRSLVFVGRVEEPVGTAGAAPSEASLLYEMDALAPGTVLPLERKRSPWSAGRATERVIVGCHPARADVFLKGEGIRAEHVRVYFPRQADGAADLLVIESNTTTVGGQPVEPRDWTSLEGGEEIDLGPWRFCYQADTLDSAGAPNTEPCETP